MKGRKLVLSVIATVIITSILTFSCLSLFASPVDVKTEIKALSKDYNLKILTEIPKDKQAIEYNSIADLERDLKAAKEGAKKGDISAFTNNMKNKKLFTPKGYVQKNTLPVMQNALKSKIKPMLIANFTRYMVFEKELNVLGLTKMRIGLMTTQTIPSRFVDITQCNSYLVGYTAIYDWTQQAWTWYAVNDNRGFYVNVYGTAETYLVVKGIPLNSVVDCTVQVHYDNTHKHPATDNTKVISLG